MTPPAMLTEILVREAAQWSKYPLAQGTPDFRAAAADWLRRATIYRPA
jgi:N-succinyldiaminopimelate aminotransferase